MRKAAGRGGEKVSWRKQPPGTPEKIKRRPQNPKRKEPIEGEKGTPS